MLLALFIVALPILGALGWVFLQIQGPAKEQIKSFGTSAGNEGSSNDDFRDFFAASVRQGPWTKQTPLAQRRGQ